MTAPLVSVLLPVRNGAPYFAQALDSILAQTLTDMEVIVVDDGSIDGTSELLAACPDKRLRVIRREGDGLVAALNTALDHAGGTYLARMDADDVCLPERLELQVAALDANPAAILAHTSARLIDEHGRPFGLIPAQALSAQERRDVLLGRRSGFPIIHPSVMIRRSVLEQAGGYRHSPSCEDHELWLRLIEVGPFLALPRVLLLYRQHGGGISRTRTVEQAVSNLTDNICARWREHTGIDLYRDDPAGYDRLRARVQALASRPIESMALARKARASARKGRLAEAAGAALRLLARGEPGMLLNRMVRTRLWAIQDAVLEELRARVS